MSETPLDPVGEHVRDLLITRLIPASAHTLYRCWTEPELLKQWFAPRPWSIAKADLDVRPQTAGQPGEDDGFRLPAIDQVLRHHRRHHLADAALADQHLLPFEPATMLGEAVPENLLAIFKPGQEFVDFAVHGAENNDHAGFPTDKRLIDQSDQSRY